MALIVALFLAASPYEVKLDLDLSLTAVAGAVVLTTELLKAHYVAPGCICAASELGPLDRAVVGPADRELSLASDIAIGVFLAAPFIAGGIETLANGAPASEWLKDALVLAETLALSLATNQIVKLAAQRPRPYAYADPSTAVGDAKLSFYSSHTSSAFALLNAFALTFAWRHPQTPWRYVIWIAANLVGAAIATMRVAAQMHFVTDVLAGAAIGAAFGIAVPYAHKSRIAVSAGALPEGAMLRLGYSW